MARFGSFPTWWIRYPGPTLKAFRGGGQSGTSIAALKILMALAVLVDFYSRKTKSSLSDFEELTGLSRPMVIRGVEELEQLGILAVDRRGHTNEYSLLVAGSDNWAKVPHDLLRQRMRALSNRGAVPLAALKIYLELLAIRPNQSTKVALSHEKLRDATGIQKRHVRPALDILFSHGLLHLEAVEGGKTNSPHNMYWVLGL